MNLLPFQLQVIHGRMMDGMNELNVIVVLVEKEERILYVTPSCRQARNSNESNLLHTTTTFMMREE